VLPADSSATSPWIIKAREVCFDIPNFQIVKYLYLTGKGQEKLPYYVHEAADSVLCVPITSAGDIVMVRQYRLPIRRVSLDFPAGRMELDDSTDASAALRELREETGYNTKQLTPLFSLDKDPGFSSSRMHVFVAQNVVRSYEPSDTRERVDVIVLRSGQVLDAIRDGRLSCAFCVAAALRVGHIWGWKEAK
jgi:ADP-ribose pyrophosphatase